MNEDNQRRNLPQEGYDARGLIEQYARWKRKAALLIWVMLGGLILLTFLFVALGWIR